MNQNDDKTPAETPKAKARLSLIQTVRLVDLLELHAKYLHDLNRQFAYLLIKYDNGIPSIYNRICEEKLHESNLFLEEFKASLEEPEDRPSQSIIVNVHSKKSDTPKPNKITTITTITVAIVTGIILALREIFK